MEKYVDADWCYRSEGNRNIVIYNRKVRRVCRLLKVTSDISEELETDEAVETHYVKQVQYYACVMDRLYVNYVSVPLMKSVNVAFLEEISSVMEDLRPGERLNKSISLCPTVLDIPDYAFLSAPYHDHGNPSFMFELKAGNVARSYSSLLSEEEHDYIPPCDVSTAANCYFCLNKALVGMNTQKRSARYCPQELFSGNTKRMRKCVAHLLEDMNCSRNRLRLFQDGVDVTSLLKNSNDIASLFSTSFPENKNSSILNELNHLLMGCLTHSKPVSRRRGSVPLILPIHKRWTGDYPSLPAGCVLSVFASAQYYGAGTLPNVQTAYDVLKSHILMNPSIVTKLCIDGPYDTGMWRLGTRPDKPPGISDDLMSAFITVRNYLIYRTAKDSSILVTFQRICSDFHRCNAKEAENVFTVSDVTGYHKFNCNVAIIDLDPKPFNKMDQYLQAEWRIYNALVRQRRCTNSAS